MNIWRVLKAINLTLFFGRLSQELYYYCFVFKNNKSTQQKYSYR